MVRMLVNTVLIVAAMLVKVGSHVGRHSELPASEETTKESRGMEVRRGAKGQGDEGGQGKEGTV